MKVGDRVKVVNPEPGYEKYQDKEGTIIGEMSGTGCGNWEVQFHDDGEREGFDPQELSLIEDFPDDFKVGDNVWIVWSSCSRYQPECWNEGVIKEIRNNGEEYRYIVQRRDSERFLSFPKEALVHDLDADFRHSKSTIGFDSSYEPLTEDHLREALEMLKKAEHPMFEINYTPISIKKKEGRMSQLSSLAEKTLDKDTKTLIEAGVLNKDLSVNDDRLIDEFIVKNFKKELATEARAYLKRRAEEQANRRECCDCDC